MTEISQMLSEPPSDKQSESLPSTVRISRNLTPWKPGQSGNPAGRPQGAKNRITQQKLGIEESLRGQLNQYMPEILGAAIEAALNGDRMMQKLLIELCISKAQTSEDETQGKDKVRVTIRNLTLETKQPEPKLVEAKTSFIEGSIVENEQIEPEDGR